MKYKLEIIVFMCGAVVMILELVGSRVLGPYVGTSTFVWTSLIGVILGSLSIGYWLGGKLADRSPNYRMLSMIILGSAAYVVFIAVAQNFIMSQMILLIKDVRISSVIASIILFTPPGILMGMVSPYAVKLKVNDLSSSGAAVGTLYALSTIGSIVGTFLAGFVLISLLGTIRILFVLSGVLFLVGLFTEPRILSRKNLIISVIFFSLALVSQAVAAGFNPRLDLETAYNRVWIMDGHDPKTDRDVRLMKINNEFSSGMFLDSDELYFDYTKFYNLAEHFNPEIKKALLIGGAGYSYPKYFLKNFPEASLDVVEIDPGVTAIARKFFNLKDDLRMRIYHEDARIFMNTTEVKYDAIYGDAFKSKNTIPFQLVTREAILKMYESLNDGGVLLINVITAIEGEKGGLLRAEYATMKDIFPQVLVFPVRNNIDGEEVQNVMLAGIKSDQPVSLVSDDQETQNQLNNLWTKDIDLDQPVLTDDFAPVDLYALKMIH